MNECVNNHVKCTTKVTSTIHPILKYMVLSDKMLMFSCSLRSCAHYWITQQVWIRLDNLVTWYIRFSFKGCWKQILHHKINATKADNRCSFLPALHTRLHKHREQQQIWFLITHSLCCVSYFSMLHIPITWQCSWFSHISKFHNSSLFHLVYSLIVSLDK